MSSEADAVAGDPLIVVDGVTKTYHVYDKPQSHLRKALFGTSHGGREFHAVSDVSFAVARGESVGILGMNGSGKSTLLQMIAGTLQPTRGCVSIRGRVSALLELGSGFNPEFTGRENVYLGASILGLRRDEIERRLPEIIDFADIGDFVDQPVKVYSSGMYARLAFSVAIAVDPDILIVDEILSVGDIAFQQRCVNRLREMREGGLTLLYVSHSVDSVKSVCARALLMEHGRLIEDGVAERVVDVYLERTRERMNEQRIAERTVLEIADRVSKVADRPVRWGRSSGLGGVHIVAVRTLDAEGGEQTAFFFGERISVEVTIDSDVDIDHLSVSFLVRDGTGVDLAGTTTFEERVPIPALDAGGRCAVVFSFDNVFRHGGYGISVAVIRVTRRDLTDAVNLHQVDAAAAFESIGRDERPVHYKFHLPVAVAVRPAT
jgi:ABC-type polysaccharide/polyol phosphate transport system ATPase subunit